jgi:CRP-like cAMP-binding protein
MEKEASERTCRQCPVLCSSIFSSLPEAGLRLLEESKTIGHYQRGQYLFYEGNSSVGIHCVQTGVVKLEKSGADGNVLLMGVVGKGGALGYHTLFTNEAHEASAIACENATVCFIPKDVIVKLTMAYPSVVIDLFVRLAKDLKTAERRYYDLFLKSAPERTAMALLFLKEHFPEPNWSRKEIAGLASTTPETVIRTLGHFEDLRIVRQKGRKVDIVNRKALFQQAGRI